MVNVIIALGSNHLQAAHIEWASQRLAAVVQSLRFSRRLWTEDIHGRGIFYMNRLAFGTTTLSATDLQRALKAIEAESGRVLSPKAGSLSQGMLPAVLPQTPHVTIDLDLMLYGDDRFHLSDWPRPYIQQLINDVL